MRGIVAWQTLQSQVPCNCQTMSVTPSARLGMVRCAIRGRGTLHFKVEWLAAQGWQRARVNYL